MFLYENYFKIGSNGFPFIYNYFKLIKKKKKQFM